MSDDVLSSGMIMLDSGARENVCWAEHFAHNGLRSSRPGIFWKIQGVQLDNLGARKARVTYGSCKRGEINFGITNAQKPVMSVGSASMLGAGSCSPPTSPTLSAATIVNSLVRHGRLFDLPVTSRGGNIAPVLAPVTLLRNLDDLDEEAISAQRAAGDADAEAIFVERAAIMGSGSEDSEAEEAPHLGASPPQPELTSAEEQRRHAMTHLLCGTPHRRVNPASIDPPVIQCDYKFWKIVHARIDIACEGVGNQRTMLMKVSSDLVKG